MAAAIDSKSFTVITNGSTGAAALPNGCNHDKEDSSENGVMSSTSDITAAPSKTADPPCLLTSPPLPSQALNGLEQSTTLLTSDSLTDKMQSASNECIALPVALRVKLQVRN